MSGRASVNQANMSGTPTDVSLRVSVRVVVSFCLLPQATHNGWSSLISLPGAPLPFSQPYGKRFPLTLLCCGRAKRLLHTQRAMRLALLRPEGGLPRPLPPHPLALHLPRFLPPLLLSRPHTSRRGKHVRLSMTILLHAFLLLSHSHKLAYLLMPLVLAIIRLRNLP